MSFGAFDVKLRGEESIGPDGSPLPATPQEILDLFDESGFLGHIIITPQWVDPNELDPLDLARYTGVLRETKFAQDGIVLTGSGMVYWLGDQQQRGPIFENTLSLSNSTFVNGINAILPDAITPGNVIAEVGTQSASFLYVTARYALEYWCSLYSAEYEVTPQGTLNAGTPASLYSTFNNPTTFIKRHGAGADPDFKHLPIANASFGRDAINFATRVIALTQVEDTSFLEGEADLSPPTSKRDIHGNLVAITDVNVETSALATNADARAAARLAQIGEPRQVTSLSTDDYDVDGTMAVGDSVYVWDPASGLFDMANEVQFRGETYWPAKLRVVGLTWPITTEMGVYFRDNTSSGNIYDLTQYVEFEEGNSTQVDVGAFSRSLIPPSVEPLGPIVAPTVNPNSAPSQPSAPSVSATDQILHIVVSHDLTKAGGGSLETWTAFLKVFASTTSGFTPGPTNYIGRIEVDEAQITLGTDVVAVFELDNATEHYFKVQPVGANGLEGPASAQASATANLIPSAAIINLVANKITAGTITASVEMTSAIITGGLIRTAVSGNRIEIAGADPDRIDYYTGEAGEISGASTQVFDSLLRITSPEFVQDEFSQVDFFGQGGPSAFTRPRILISAGPSSSNGLDFLVSTGNGNLDLLAGSGDITLSNSAVIDLLADGGNQRVLLDADDAWLIAGRNTILSAGTQNQLRINNTTRVRVQASGISFLPDGTERFLIQDFQVGCLTDLKMSGNVLYLGGASDSNLQEYDSTSARWRAGNNKLRIGNFVSGADMVDNAETTATEFTAIINDVSDFRLKDIDGGRPDKADNRGLVSQAAQSLAMGRFKGKQGPSRLMVDATRVPDWVKSKVRLYSAEAGLEEGVEGPTPAKLEDFGGFSNSSMHAWHIQSIDDLYEKLEAIAELPLIEQALKDRDSQ